jgi:hypothetical protein
VQSPADRSCLDLSRAWSDLRKGGMVIEVQFSQSQMAVLWASYNNLCMQMMALCYIAGERELARAFSFGVNTAALMSMMHTMLVP